MLKLFDDKKEVEEGFKVNENYAKQYDIWRSGEEFQKLKDKYGNEPVQSSDGSSSSSDDDDAEELTEEIEKQFFKTLSYLKNKDSRIYDENVRFFEKPSTSANGEVKKKNKTEAPMTVGAYQRKILMETGGQFVEEEKIPFEKMSNVQQEKAIKESFKNVAHDSDSDENHWGGMFEKKQKTDMEKKEEEDDYRKWLAGQRDKPENQEDVEEMEGLRNYWADPKLNEGEQFLRDYILNKRFLDKDDSPVQDESDSDDMLNRQEDFERKFNFRFEEPDQEFIKRYPRTMENVMRKKDDRRKRHRDDVKMRKETERAQKDEELKRMKALKRREIMDKIKKLQEITGNKEIEFENKDVEGDFNPEEYDQRMSELFNEDYYEGNEEEEKPEFPELDDELEIEKWDEWDGTEVPASEPHCEDEDFNMDCDYDPSATKATQDQLIQNTKGRGKKRRKSKFATAVAKQKPLFDPQDKSFEKYLDEYYALDYEDLIGDLPCRFKYRKVVPNDYGLSIEEILTAPDKELNQWVSMKKITQRRTEDIEKYDVIAYKKKAQNFAKKKKILPTLYMQNNEEASVEETKSAKKRKKKLSQTTGHCPDLSVQSKNTVTMDLEKQKGKKRLISENTDNNKELMMKADNNQNPENRLKNKKKKINEHSLVSGDEDNSYSTFDLKEQKKHNNSSQVSEVRDDNSLSVESSVKKKKKKQKVLSKVCEVKTDSNLSELKKKKKKLKKPSPISDNNLSVRKKIEEPSQVSEGLKDNSHINGGLKNKKKLKKHCQISENPNQNIGSIKNKKKKKKKKLNTGATDGEVRSGDVNRRVQKNNNKKRFSAETKRPEEAVLGVSDSRLKAYGLHPKKFKNSLKYANK